jgi:peptidoglycan/xylan/chitin deacetylase (PgdA/CDA1 family)
VNIAGPLATLIFAVTVLTVFGGVFAYGIYKARERRRERPSARRRLEYFVEFTLEPGMTVAIDAELASRARRPWGLYALSSSALLGMVAATAYYCRAGLRLVLQGAWDDRGSAVEFPPPPPLAAAAIGSPQAFGARRSRGASLFPSQRFDANGDGRIQPDERRELHASVPLTVVVTIDDNGHVQGLAWLRETLDRYGLAGRVTFFLTGNYLEGRPSYLGGPVSAWWSALAQTGFIGIHGLTHERGTEWSRQRWAQEHSATMSAIVSKVSPPPGWSWSSYPWGSRAPFLTFDDAYFSALEEVTPQVVYDASMIVHPYSPASFQGDRLVERDQSWPFSLDAELPTDVELPYSSVLGHRVRIGSHPIMEVPAYAWAVRDGHDRLSWVPPLDVNLFELSPCSGNAANSEVVAAFERNLDAHYRGNRAPFQLGLHAQNYTADRKCERRTLEAMFDTVEKLVRGGEAIRFEAIPRLVGQLLEEP